MKYKIFVILSAAALLAACGGQDEIYKEWVKKGGYQYPAKAVNMAYEQGYKSVTISWEKPMDPSVKTASIYWDNYSQSQDFDYASYPDGKINFKVESLEDRSYTFDIVNFDSENNRSLPAEITVSPYGESWLVSRSERMIVSAIMDGNDAKIVMTKSTSEMVSTKFRYRNLEGQWVDCETVLAPGETEVTFRNAMKGKKFQFSSSFCPSYGKDTVYRPWTVSNDGISYKLNGSRWKVDATQGQTFSENGPSNIFDGKVTSASRWHSSRTEGTSSIFPKILSIDTGASPGEEFAFTKFVFYENPTSVSMRYIKNLIVYVGSKEYDPNSTDYLSDFGIPFLNGLFSTAQPVQQLSASTGAAGNYIAIVFPNSWSNDGYIDLWELEPYGYIPSQAD